MIPLRLCAVSHGMNGEKIVVCNQTKAERSADAVGGMIQSPVVLPNSLLLDYRAAVEDLVEQAGRDSQVSEVSAVEGFVARRLAQPEFGAVLSHLDGGEDTATASLIREIRDYRADARSSSTDFPTLIRILLLSQIDSVWWSRTTPFTSDADVLCSTELVELDRSGPRRYWSSSTGLNRPDCLGALGTGRSTRCFRESAPVLPGCGSPVRGQLSSLPSTRSLSISPPHYRRELLASG